MSWWTVVPPTSQHHRSATISKCGKCVVLRAIFSAIFSACVCQEMFYSIMKHFPEAPCSTLDAKHTIFPCCEQKDHSLSPRHSKSRQNTKIGQYILEASGPDRLALHHRLKVMWRTTLPYNMCFAALITKLSHWRRHKLRVLRCCSCTASNSFLPCHLETTKLNDLLNLNIYTFYIFLYTQFTVYDCFDGSLNLQVSSCSHFCYYGHLANSFPRG